MIVTVTLNPAVDHTVRVSEPLTNGAIHRTGESRLQVGGKGVNVAQYLARLEVPVAATGLLGVGTPVGRFFREELDAQGLPHDFVSIEGATRLNTTVLTPDGEYKINCEGPSVGDEAIASVIEAIDRREPAVVAVGGSLPGDLSPTAIDRIADAGDWPVGVDVDGETLRVLDGDYAFCKPNREELSAATGMPTETREECFAAAERLRDQGFEMVIASLGADGALLVDGTSRVHLPAPDVDIADTSGGGDGLLAGVLAAVLADADAETMLGAGVEVATAIVSVPGTAAPDLEPLASLSPQFEDRGA